MKIGVVQFPGSNCERETKLALERVELTPVDCFWHSPANLVERLDGFVIVGGFSYEDRVRSGLIASKDPFMQLLAKAAKAGKPILGICNGAQILVESGLVPGFEDQHIAMALTTNQRVKDGKLLGTGFYNDWVYLKSNQADAKPLHVPMAHAEGRFLLSEELYQTLAQAGATFYYYCDAEGNMTPEFPVNPNGSVRNLAAVSNAAGNVMAMMPHPERSIAGDVVLQDFFLNARQRQEAGGESSPLKQSSLRCETRDALSSPASCGQGLRFAPYQENKQALHYWVSLLIHDNEAISLENTLQGMGLPVSLKKWVHWEVAAPQSVDTLIRESDELFNRQKEYLSEAKGRQCYVIRPHEDELALEKQESLSKLCKMNVGVKREIVWGVDYPTEAEAEVKAVLEGQAILGNPLAHEGFIL